MERKIIIYKPIKEWKLGDVEKKEESSRLIINTLIIGEYQHKGKTIEYITEEIYKHILDDILNSPRQYQITVKQGMVPPLTITCNGQLVMYNQTVRKQFTQTKELLHQLPREEIFDSYKEMRFNLNGRGKLGDGTKLLMFKIKKETSLNYSTTFIREVIGSFLEDTMISTEDESVQYLHSLSYEELLSHAFEIISYQWKKEVTEDYLLELYNQAENKEQLMYQFYQKINEELLFRFLKGTLKGK